ncbi:hypothetical protein PVAP13_6NG115406 [Panicum virgatum]|uniref:Uncharacterized protein n=1 Tax=Panicum virgatum TaxID=38727 RepID=A0A8T0R053_PANVG|nr:hypothetical protein PVAP13_6NG115406 [Panicum virgatum]
MLLHPPIKEVLLDSSSPLYSLPPTSTPSKLGEASFMDQNSQPPFPVNKPMEPTTKRSTKLTKMHTTPRCIPLDLEMRTTRECPHEIEEETEFLGKSLQRSKNEDESAHITSSNTTLLSQRKRQTKGKSDQIVSWVESKSVGEMTIAIDTGKKFKKPKIELSVAVIGSAISFVASVDVEKCLENKLKFTLAVFLATILSLLFSTLIMLFSIFYLDKAAYISKYITLSITIVTDHLPATLEKTTPYLISFYQDLCRTLTSETLVWILTFWCLMPSTEGSFQLRFRIKARKKKDCHSTVFERLDGVLPLLHLQHLTCTWRSPILTALPSFPIWSGAGKEGGVSCIMESLVHILFLPQLLHMIQVFSSCAASALPPLQGKKYATALAPFLISQKGQALHKGA